MSVAIVDYGSGNLHSAAKAFERAARDSGHAEAIHVTSDPAKVAAASRVVLPGVGAFADCRRGLDDIPGMVEALNESVLQRGRPFFGICVGTDAFHDPRADGSSVYALSEHGASDEAARWLADRENSADRLLGGVKLGDKDDMLASVLLDLSQRATIGASIDVGKQVLQQLGRLGPLHRSRVQQAAFAVLKSPDIPSILVETAFISNPHQERELNTARYQESLASSILAGVRDYYSINAPAGTVLAARHGEAGTTYVIAPGDTLSGIAARYNVSVASLRAVNGLDDDTIQPGEKLTIPDSTDS